ncbi:MAG: phosphate ABC transporter ATP-binding protein [Myxococcota bacterium]
MIVAVPAPAGAALELEGVTVRYGAHTAVRDVRLAVPAGEVVALLGPSGAGKSSLLLAVNRLHELDPGVVVEGAVRVAGADVRGMDPLRLRRRVGLLFQRPAPFPLSIGENVAFPLRAHGTPRAEVAGRVEDALRRAALWDEVKDRLAAPATGLSGGQQQRLCLARALALEPEVLLLDEPCAALDPRSTARVEEALAELGVPMLLVTHNLAQARRLADRCACLWPGPDGGELVDEGPTERVFGAPAHGELAGWMKGDFG